MKFVNLIIFFFCFSGYSQDLMVEYKHSQNVGKGVDDYSHFLLTTTDETYYIMPSHKFYNSYEELYSDNDYKSHATRKCIYKKINDDNLFFYGYIPKSKSVFDEKFVQDKVNTKFEMLKDVDVLLGYKCNSARAKFRGRTYKIWFTKEISTSAGPWKFNGLPGLILKVEDDNGIFSFTATRIVQGKNFKVVEKNAQSFQNLSSLKPITYKEFVEEENITFTKFRDQAIASLPKGTVFKNMKPIRYDLIESEFEWEENKKP